MNTYLLLKRYGCSNSGRSWDVPAYIDTADKSIKEMDVQGYEDYSNKHGHHFTNALAEAASKVMQNTDGSTHFWSCEDVQNAFDRNGYIIPKTATIGDVCYLANMAYADYYPTLLTEQQCIKYAYLSITDPDGYEGMHFLRYISDNIGRGIEIHWKNFL